MKKIITKKRILLIAASIIIIFAAVALIINLGNYVKIRGQRLNEYTFSSGGGMDGGYHSETVKRFDDKALIKIESAEWYAQEPTVTEYLTDAKVLDELEAVVRKYKMNFWNGKKFTNMFVFDGESESYDFDFDDVDISFSSQIYPLRYIKKLAQLDSIVKKYIETGEKLTVPSLTYTDDE